MNVSKVFWSLGVCTRELSELVYAAREPEALWELSLQGAGGGGA
jgi:mevalonate kinase